MRRGWIVLAAFLILITVTFLIFYFTGGRGLLRVARYTLVRNMPDSLYTWSDFVPNTESKRISGFYSSTFSQGDMVAIWTLLGLKRYRHTEGSVYYYRDTCGVIKAVIENQKATEPQKNPYTVYLDISKWREQMRSEYLVTVQWGGEGVDKLWSMSGRYKIPGRIGEGVCD